MYTFITLALSIYFVFLVFGKLYRGDQIPGIVILYMAISVSLLVDSIFDLF